MSSTNSPQRSTSPPHSIVSDDVDPQPPTSEGHSAYHINSIFTAATLVGWALASILGIFVIKYTFSSNIPIVIKLGATASAFSQIGRVWKLVRRMRRVEMRQEDDLEAGVVEEGEEGQVEEFELEERGRMLTREDRKGEERK
jgi:membrane protein implicated in regulation of membrane protease activity